MDIVVYLLVIIRKFEPKMNISVKFTYDGIEFVKLETLDFELFLL